MNLLNKSEKDTSLEMSDQYYRKNRTKFIIKNVLFLFLLLFIGCVLLLSNIAANSESSFAQSVKKNFLINQISHLISADTKTLKGENDGQTNLLILGMGGYGHDGALLTDTIIVLSYNYETGETSLVSVPRDFLTKTGENQYQKIIIYILPENTWKTKLVFLIVKK